MIFQIFLLIFLLTIVLLISKNIVKNIYIALLKFTGDKRLAVWILAILFLPGTIAHEVSHLIMALVLRVATGPISIFPKFDRGKSPFGDSPLIDKKKEVRVKIGHIMVAKTDPVRLTLIGVAPMIAGLTIIYFTGQVIGIGIGIGDSPPSGTVPFLVSHPSGVIIFCLIYLLFITSTSMFASRQDLKSLLITMPAGILILTALYLAGVKIVFDENLVELSKKILTNLNGSLILTAGVDFAILIILSVLGRLG